jgi:hypothetical protein
MTVKIGKWFCTSTELIEMAMNEYTNRVERFGIHDRASWISGWMSGYLAQKKRCGEHWGEQKGGAE